MISGLISTTPACAVKKLRQRKSVAINLVAAGIAIVNCKNRNFTSLAAAFLGPEKRQNRMAFSVECQVRRKVL